MPPPTDPTLEFEHNLSTDDSRKDAAESGPNGHPCPKHNTLSTAPVVHPEHRPEPLVELDSLPQPEPLQDPSHMSCDEDPKSSTYPYQPLQHGKHIRLLLLNSPTSPHDPRVISATLQNVELNLESSSPQPYRALSYEWGPPPEENTNLPTINLDGYKVRIRQNLYDALKAITATGLNKQGSASIPLWVDALCINQSDDNEKGHQVELMRDIFAAAETVLVWLGNESGKTGTAMQVMDEYIHAFDECLQTPKRRMMVIEEETTEDIDFSSKKLEPHVMAYRVSKSRFPVIRLLDRLCRASYWRRVWIIQEFVMAKNYILTFDKDYLTKTNFEKALEAVLTEDFLFPLFLGSPRLERRLAKLPKSPAHQMINLRKLKKEKKTTLGEWMDMCLEKRFGATDPRDYVYALVGISDDCTGNITPDYTRSVRDVYFMAVQVMRTSSSRDDQHVLQYGAFAKLMGLPEEDAFKARLSWNPLA